MSYFPNSVDVEIQTFPGGLETWTNISGDIVSPIKCNLGFSDGDPLSRLAPGSDMRFDLINLTGTYDPSSTFYKGQKIRLRIKWGSQIKTKFFGYIDHIGLDVGTWGARQAHVVCVDWLTLASKTPVRAVPSLTNTTVDAAVRALLTQMQMQPEALDFEAGEVVLPSVFDQITVNSTIYSELQNLVMGEFGYIYMTEGGRTLKIESALSRSGDGSDYKTIGYYLSDGIGTDLLLEDGTNLLLEDGTSLLTEGTETYDTFDSNFGEEYTTIAINHGDNLTNKISTSAVPVVVGASVAVLYKFDLATGSKPFVIASGSSYVMQGQYKDPTAGGAQISGSAVVTPEVTTDWKFNSLATGAGTDLSANITIVFTAGQSGFKAVITNSGAAGFITKFNVRGIPVYRYSPVETVIQDQRSIWDYGDYSMQFTRQYGQSSDDVAPFTFRLLMRDRKPRTIFANPKFNAFDTADHLAGFLGLDIGDQIRLSSTKPASDALYYIQGVKFTILPGSESITFDYVTAETLAGDPVGITQAAIETTGDQYIDFGYIPVISSIVRRAICIRYSVPTNDIKSPLQWAINPALGIYSAVTVNARAGDFTNYRIRIPFSTTDMTAYANGNILDARNQWIDLVFLYDSSSTANTPQVYENGVALAVTVDSAPAGVATSETGAPFRAGTVSYVGKYENVAIYNRILSPAEITAIHNSGTRLPFASYPKSGLKFFFGGVDNDTYADKLDAALGVSDVVFDLQNGYTGQPINNPILRATG